MKIIQYIIIAFLAISNVTDINAQEKTIIYFGDPMCSWCYGFGPEISKVKAAFPDVKFEFVMGGLRPYGKETMASLKSFLEDHWTEIEERTGQKFNHDILSQKDFIYDTEPASRAVVVMRDMKPEQTLEFFKAVQQLFYLENKDPRLVDSYKTLVESYGVKFEAFKTNFESEAYKIKTKADFVRAQEIGIRGFPSMVIKVGTEYALLSNGYREAEAIISGIETFDR